MFRTLPVITDFLCTMDRNFSESAVQSSTVTTTNALPSCDFTRYQNHSEGRPLTSISPKPVERIMPKSTVHTESNNVVSVSGSSKSCENVSLSDVKVELVNAEIWKKFHDVGNEMKVTKPGRRIFPVADFKLTGLLPNDVYKVAIAFAFVDEFRYQFSRARGTWSPSVKDDRVREPCPEHRRCYEHPSSPTCGRHWTSLPLAFDDIAITNHLETEGSANLVCLPTLRKYRIQLVITKLHCTQCQGSHTRQIDIPLTDFIAVTGYYNMKVTQLKIENNPAARYLRQREKNVGCPESKQPTKQKNRKRKREENEPSHREISSATLSKFALTSPSETSSATLSRSSTSPSETSSATLSCLSPISPSETSSATLSWSSSTSSSETSLASLSWLVSPRETSPATLSRSSSTSLGETSPATLSKSSAISSSETSSATLSGPGPYCYIDLTSTTFSLRQTDRLVHPPSLHHVTYPCQSAEQFTAGSQMDYYIPGCPLTHLSASVPPSPCATPETYVQGPAVSTMEVNPLVPYNYMYNFDSYYNSLYGNYHGSRCDNFYSSDYSIYGNYPSANYDNYLCSNYDN